MIITNFILGIFCTIPTKRQKCLNRKGKQKQNLVNSWIKVPCHSIVRSLPPLADLDHRKPLKCEQPWASSLQGKTVQQATQMHPTGTSEPCGYQQQTEQQNREKNFNFKLHWASTLTGSV